MGPRALKATLVDGAPSSGMESPLRHSRDPATAFSASTPGTSHTVQVMESVANKCPALVNAMPLNDLMPPLGPCTRRTFLSAPRKYRASCALPSVTTKYRSPDFGFTASAPRGGGNLMSAGDTSSFIVSPAPPQVPTTL